ncbi:MAG TPA: hypothetical protein VKU02_18430 [Gemmataceae bacterium]|nr:hypothetical protein [Gemmataceae bacterium]
MADDAQARRERADQLRRQIDQLKSAPESPEEGDPSSMKSGESPKEYVARRMRDLGRKKPPRK